jgi:hypothetical protein
MPSALGDRRERREVQFESLSGARLRAQNHESAAEWQNDKFRAYYDGW